jgi:hypothetical protein
MVMLIPKRIDIKYINPPRSKQHYKLHPLMHTYEKAGCQANKLYQLPIWGQKKQSRGSKVVVNNGS